MPAEASRVNIVPPAVWARGASCRPAARGPAAPPTGATGITRILPPMLRRTVLILALLAGACSQTSAAGGDDTARIALGLPSGLDPAATGDAGSAAFIAQFFETLTTFDETLELRPALAESWRIEDGGRRVIFHLRPGLTFSDGSSLRAADVVRSWLRIIDPAAPSPLATLMLDVEGALEYITGNGDADDVGLTADEAANDVIVDLVRPAAEFVTVVASPTFGIVPPGVGTDADALLAGESFVVSGGDRLAEVTSDTMVLRANPAYWAGPPAIGEIIVVTDLGGASAVDAFQEGELDYAPISEFDASWIAYDQALGPQLREVPSLSTDFYGFDTSRPPFDDVRIRQAFAAAVDWRRIAFLAATDPDAVATSMVPPGIPGRSDRDVVPVHDPEAARALLVEAGFPGGQGFPDVTLLTGGSAYDEAVVSEIERELGVTLRSEVMDFETYFGRLDSDPPQMWLLSWVADYPGRNDFLGVLLGTGSTNNYGRWSSEEFDAAILEAGATTDEAAASAAYDRAEAVVQRDAPIIPISYGSGWALARDGLLGAGQNGMGALRFAGLAWGEP
jgi:ABC-type transport system substrate-binding protein